MQLQRGLRAPSCGEPRRQVVPKVQAPLSAAVPAPVVLAPLVVQWSSAYRNAVACAALSFESRLSVDEEEHEQSTGRRLPQVVITPEDAPAVNCRVVVAHFVTKPGQQLFITGSTPALGEWDADRAIPLEWQEGHSHVVHVALPPSQLVQAKLLLKENGRPAQEEQGEPRDLMLMPVNGKDAAQAAGLERARARRSPASGDRLDYQILCHFGSTEATQILRLPVTLPAKEPGDRSVLCKFVVLLDGIKLEPRQYPVVVGSAAELGAWNPAEGVKLMRQVGGYWTRRAELPLFTGDIQAKVVICNPDGEPVAWEPGTVNRVLKPGNVEGGADAGMHIFVCRWSQPAHTPVVSVSVEREDPSTEYVKQLDAAQREIGLLRQAVTAKSRQVQTLEGDLSVSRRTERALRDELAAMRAQATVASQQEVEAAQRAELAARKEVGVVKQEMQRMSEIYERQILFLEKKLDEMEQELKVLDNRLAAPAAAATNHSSGNGRSNGNGNGRSNGNGNGRSNGNGHSNGNGNGHSNGNGHAKGNGSSVYESSSSRPITRANWR